MGLPTVSSWRPAENLQRSWCLGLTVGFYGFHMVSHVGIFALKGRYKHERGYRLFRCTLTLEERPSSQRASALLLPQGAGKVPETALKRAGGRRWLFELQTTKQMFRKISAAVEESCRRAPNTLMR